MSENVNLIPATELPEAEGNDLKFLCLENGQMKKKDVAGMGLTADVFANITVLGLDDDGNAEFTVADEKVPSYTELKAMLLNGTPLKASGLFTVVPWEELNTPHYSSLTMGYVWLYDQQDGQPEQLLLSLWSFSLTVYVSIYSDGTREWFIDFHY